MSKPRTPEQRARSEAFLRECFKDGRCIRMSEHTHTRRWVDKTAHKEWLNISGNYTVSHIERPKGSVPLKTALLDIADACNASWHQVRGHWDRGHLPLRVMRRLATRVDVDPATISDGIHAMFQFLQGNALPTNNRVSDPVGEPVHSPA